MYINKLKLIYIHSEILQVSAEDVAIFREAKDKGCRYKMKLQEYQNQSTHIK